MRYVVDNSVLMAAYFPDEVSKPHALALFQAFSNGEIELLAPHLLVAEAHHAVLKAVRGKRVTLEHGRAIVAALLDLEIPLSTVSDGVFGLAYKYGCSGYDAFYLRLAQHEGVPLLTADARLVNQLKRSDVTVIELSKWRAG